MDTPFMEFFAHELSKHGYRVVRFEFPYMAERRTTGKKKPPNRQPILEETWLQVIAQFPTDKLYIGGKSMGGRVASMIADCQQVRGAICLGYPFHPPGNPEKLRIEHLQQQTTPTLILQGTRDPFGREEEVTTYPLASSVHVHWLPDGDHGFKPRRSSGRTEEENWAEAVDAIRSFIDR